MRVPWSVSGDLAALSIPSLPGRVSGCPELLEQVLVVERVHRLPEALVAVGSQVAGVRERLEGLAFPHRLAVGDVVGDARLEDEEPAVDPTDRKSTRLNSSH